MWKSRLGPVVAVGLGRYGQPVLRPLNSFKNATLIVGGSRTGKTRLASSISDQQVRTFGGGSVTIDYKGDDAVVKEKARLAQQEGRSFLHFSLLPPNGSGEYPQLHPYAPPVPARYDGLARGNGKSKAEMFLKSVPRDGDAAAYLRSAQEVSELAWNIAALTGFDRTVGQDGKTRISSLEVLTKMLSTATDGELERQAQALSVGTVLKYYPHLSERDAEVRIDSLRGRVQAVSAELKKSGSIVAKAVSSTRELASTYVNSSAFYPGTFGTGRAPAGQIDLIRAILRGEIVVFSLPAQIYPDFAAMMGTMILLDLQNAVATLRGRQAAVAAFLGVPLGGADSTPWPPFVVQIEELGSAANQASAEALINLINKSADVGIRVVVSTQSLSDIRTIDDGKGVWLQRLLGLIANLFVLQIGSRDDDEEVSDFSGSVTKQYATNETSVSNNRFRLFTGASESKKVRGAEQQENRIPVGTAQALDRDQREMLFVTKDPKLQSVHTTAPEGPNNWYEVLEMVTVLEAAHGYNPFDADPEVIQQMRDAARELGAGLNAELAKPDSLLYQIVDNSDAKVDVTPKAAPTPFTADVSAIGEPPPEDLYADPYDAGATFDVYEDVPPAPDPAGWDALIASDPRDR